MTPEERFEKIEDILARWIEQGRKDHEENKILWRQSRDQIEATSRDMREGFRELREEMREGFREMREGFRELRENSKAADERVDRLVLAIGEFIRTAKRNGQ